MVVIAIFRVIKAPFIDGNLSIIDCYAEAVHVFRNFVHVIKNRLVGAPVHVIEKTVHVHENCCSRVLRILNFSPDLLLDKHFGDWTTICETPSIVKTRPLSGDNINNVILNLDKVRHFVFLKDKRTFASKWDKAVFRGAAYQPHRRRFMEKFFGHPLVDCGNTAEKSDLPKEWSAPLITLYDHLKYKFVISLEGTDVASNLKWVMSSNSVAVMPRPKYESWFMEGRLQPGVHYIEIKDDY